MRDKKLGMILEFNITMRNYEIINTILKYPLNIVHIF